MGMHYACAAMTEQPHWLLSEPDAKAYARYVANALRHMPMTVAQKWVDFTALGGAFFVFTGGRIIQSMQLAGRIGGGPAAQRRPPPQQAPGGGAQVFQFTPNPAQEAPDGAAFEPEIPLNPSPDQPAA